MGNIYIHSSPVNGSRPLCGKGLPRVSLRCSSFGELRAFNPIASPVQATEAHSGPSNGNGYPPSHSISQTPISILFESHFRHFGKPRLPTPGRIHEMPEMLSKEVYTRSYCIDHISFKCYCMHADRTYIDIPRGDLVNHWRCLWRPLFTTIGLGIPGPPTLSKSAIGHLCFS